MSVKGSHFLFLALCDFFFKDFLSPKGPPIDYILALDIAPTWDVPVLLSVPLVRFIVNSHWMDFLLYRVYFVRRCRFFYPLYRFISVQSGSIWRSVSVCRISRTCLSRRTIVSLGPIGCSASVAIQSFSLRVSVCLIFGVFFVFSLLHMSDFLPFFGFWWIIYFLIHVFMCRFQHCFDRHITFADFFHSLT